MLDETKTNRDSSQATVDTSKVVEGSTSKVAAPTTFTREQLEAEKQKAASDALAKAGRDAKTLAELRGRLDAEATDLAGKQAAWQRQREEAEENAVADDPVALSALRTKRQKEAEDKTKSSQLAEREATIAKREKEVESIVEQHKILTRTQLAAEVAVEKNVSMDSILKLAKEDTREAYEAVADLLPKATKEKPTLTPDSGRTSGGTPLGDLAPLERISKLEEKLRK